MSPETHTARAIPFASWISLSSAAATATIVGFASTILIIMEAARAVGASPAQQASWAAALCFGMAATTLILSFAHRMPIITAWSTPGAALIATTTGISYENALGAFVLAGILMCLAALVTPLARAIARIPPAIAAAMLAGVLLRYCLGVPGAAVAMPFAVLPVVALYFSLRIFSPLFAVPAAVAAGVIAAFATGTFASCCAAGISWPVWTTPQFDMPTLIGLGIPLFIVTMASQNLPGFAVLKAAGYAPPVKSALWVTGLASTLLAPFGAHAVNMAAITASIVAGPECHPDPQKRWLMCWPYFALYVAIGLFVAMFIQILGALPGPLIATIAGLALFGPLLGGMTAMFKSPDSIEAGLATFLVTASGLSVMGIGPAFWGLCAGLLAHAARRMTSPS